MKKGAIPSLMEHLSILVKALDPSPPYRTSTSTSTGKLNRSSADLPKAAIILQMEQSAN